MILTAIASCVALLTASFTLKNKIIYVTFAVEITNQDFYIMLFLRVNPDQLTSGNIWKRIKDIKTKTR